MVWREVEGHGESGSCVVHVEGVGGSGGDEVRLRVPREVEQLGGEVVGVVGVGAHGLCSVRTCQTGEGTRTHARQIPGLRHALRLIGWLQ